MGDAIKHYAEHIHQLLPATGWRVFGCYIEDGEAFVEEVAVVGWGILRSVQRECEEITHNYDDEIQLLVCSGNVPEVLPLGRYAVESDSTVRAFPPGVEFTDERKTDLEESARGKIAWDAKCEEVRKLYAAGGMLDEIASQMKTSPIVVELILKKASREK